MKRMLPWISLLVLILLAACGTLGGGKPDVQPISTPTLSPDQIQTQINQMLTLMPTNTGQPGQAVSPTAALPTVAVDTPAVVDKPTAAATDTPQVVEPTATAQAQAATATPQPATATPAAAATATQPSGPTFTPAPGDPRARLGNPTSTDPMDNATTWVWPTGSDKYTSATFSGGKQTIVALTGTDGWRLANPTGQVFSNIYLEATIQTGQCSGSDHYGLMFRAPSAHDPDQGYLFGLTCDGRYSLRRWNGQVGTKGEMKWLVDWKASTAIDKGANKTNRLGVMMVGSRILLYANGSLLTEVKDTLFPSGYFGVFVGSDNTTDLTIQVDQMAYWLNPQP